eukprot:TRINITY_DN1133_c0_g1_i1.p1 TRINITY_DN1133_c0_g1~~TRINITY_DN1133_c0_g1_i1.p1  ORF type:complete len:487 (+),score=149.98 TRINITY_DN1133_c0_g1_i1:1-1461(+)
MNKRLAQMELEQAKKEAEKEKNLGNEFFKGLKYGPAIQHYTKAIELDPTNAVLYSNRAIANLKIENYGFAIADSTKAVELDPKMAKAYYRRGCAHYFLGKLDLAMSDFKSAIQNAPADKEARDKFEQCKKAKQQKLFAEAISMDHDKKTVVETLMHHLEAMEIGDDYRGPKMTVPVTSDFVEKMMEEFKEQRKIHKKVVYQIGIEAKKLLQQQPTLVEISIPEDAKMTVCGDVHGQFYDLLNIFKLNGLPSEKNMYLFNGDFVDRGSFSVEVLLTLLAWKLCYPNYFFLARGNHESKMMNKMYGFEGEMKKKYSEMAYDLYSEVFCVLPLAHVIENKVIVVHGGLFSKDGVTLEDIKNIDRNREPPEGGLMSELLWSDPQPVPGRGPSKRGVGLAFGPDITKKFLETNKLELVIRSHEVKDQGYEIEADGKLITVFSAPNYCDQVGNKGAFIQFTKADMKPKITSFDAVPHPNVPPMAYASPMYGF